jgi:protein SCO1/2
VLAVALPCSCSIEKKASLIFFLSNVLFSHGFSCSSFLNYRLAGKPAIGGPWSLVDLEGKLVTNASFQGKWLLLYFGFARCPDICPSEMLKIARVIDKLKETHPTIAKQIVPVFVSVDPARDSLSALKAYAKDFHPDYVFLTGSPTQVQQMAKKYRVYVSKADETEDGDYLVDHSIVVYFHDDKGELSDCFTQSMRPNDISEKIVERMTAVTKIA